MLKVRVLAMVAAFSVSAPAFALDLAEVNGMIDAKRPPAEIAELITKSTDPWLPHDVYALIDRRAPVEITKAAAGKAAMFYDGKNLLPMDDLWKREIATVPPQTIDIKSDAEFSKIFEFFDSIKAESDAAKKGAGAKPTKNASETDNTFDKRARAADEQLVGILGPIEGKIDQTTFSIEVPLKLGAYDGSRCWGAPTYHVDLSSQPFQSWRNTNGTKGDQVVVLDKKSTNVASVKWIGTTPYGFDVVGKSLCPYEYAGELGGQGVKLKLTMKRTRKGEDWTGHAVIVGARSGEVIESGK